MRKAPFFCLLCRHLGRLIDQYVCGLPPSPLQLLSTLPPYPIILIETTASKGRKGKGKVVVVEPSKQCVPTSSVPHMFPTTSIVVLSMTSIITDIVPFWAKVYFSFGNTYSSSCRGLKRIQTPIDNIQSSRGSASSLQGNT